MPFEIFEELCQRLTADEWFRILLSHRLPSVRMYASWALCQLWDSLPNDLRMQVFYHSISDYGASLTYSGCCPGFERVADIFAKKLSLAITDTAPFAEYTARRMMEPIDHQSSGLYETWCPLVLPTELDIIVLRQALEKRMNSHLTFEQSSIYIDQPSLADLSEVLPEQFEVIVLDQLRALCEFWEQSNGRGPDKLDSPGPTHFSLAEIFIGIEQSPLPVFIEPAVRLADILIKFKVGWDRSRHGLLQILFTLLLKIKQIDDDLAESVVHSVIGLMEITCKSAGLDPFFAYAVDDYLDSFKRSHDSLSSRSAYQAMKGMSNLPARSESELPEEARCLIQHWRRREAILDKVLALLPHFFLVGPITMKTLIDERPDQFELPKIQKLLSSDALIVVNALRVLLRHALKGMDSLQERCDFLSGIFSASKKEEDDLQLALAEVLTGEELSTLLRTSPKVLHSTTTVVLARLATAMLRTNAIGGITYAQRAIQFCADKDFDCAGQFMTVVLEQMFLFKKEATSPLC